MESNVIDVAKVSDTYARARIDADLILNLCMGINRLTAENQTLKSRLEALEPKKAKV